MKNKAVIYQRVCANCGKIFNPSNIFQANCKKCSRVEKSPKLVSSEIVCFDKTCLHCGCSFRTDRIMKKYCSDECREEFNKNATSKEYEVAKEVIFRRDGYRCIYCGASSVEDGVKLHLEHIYPISRGGKEDLFNLATSCERCNTIKNATILPEELILRIWERNEKLNEKIDNKTYDELLDVFRRNIKLRNRQR